MLLQKRDRRNPPDFGALVDEALNNRLKLCSGRQHPVALAISVLDDLFPRVHRDLLILMSPYQTPRRHAGWVTFGLDCAHLLAIPWPQRTRLSNYTGKRAAHGAGWTPPELGRNIATLGGTHLVDSRTLPLGPRGGTGFSGLEFYGLSPSIHRCGGCSSRESPVRD